MEAAPRAPQPEDVRNFIDQSTTRLVQQANDGLRRMADTLRQKNPDEMLRDAETFARRNPALFFGAAAVAGFLAVRFLKASSPSTSNEFGNQTDYNRSQHG